MAKHTNQSNGNCPKCDEIFHTYPDFHPYLRTWFCALQQKHPEAHISCAGRGQMEQEAAFQRGASRAHYGQSAHNYNVAIDVFRLLDDQYDLDLDWFKEVIEPNLSPNLNWYGNPSGHNYSICLVSSQARVTAPSVPANTIVIQMVNLKYIAAFITSHKFLEKRDITKSIDKALSMPTMDNKKTITYQDDKDFVSKIALMCGLLYYERPHIELLEWRKMRQSKEILLVE